MAVQLVLFVIVVVFTIFLKASNIALFLKSTICAARTPGPSTWELLRNYKFIPYDIVNYAIQWCEKYDFKPYCVLFDATWILLSDPDDIAVVMQDKRCSNKAERYYGDLNKYMGDNLVSANGEYWKRHRNAINPAFHKLILKSYIPVFNFQAQRFIVDLRRFHPESIINMSAEVHKNGFLTTMKTIIAHELEFEGTEMVCEALDEITEFIHVKAMSPIYFFLFERFRKEFHQAKSNWYRVAKVVRDIIKGRIEKVGTILKSNSRDFTPVSVLDHMLVKKNLGELPLNDEELCTEMLALAVAGAETVAATNALVLAFLAFHQDVQRDVLKEIYSILGDSDRPATMEDIQKMELLDRVIKETLRLYPPGVSLLRQAQEEININGTIVPKGGLIALVLMSLHRNPRSFENPNAFIPDRFLPGYSERMKKYSYIPFSMGARSCIGLKYAEIAMKVFLSTFFRNFEVRPDGRHKSVSDIPIRLGVTIRFPEGIPLRIYPLKSNRHSVFTNAA